QGVLRARGHQASGPHLQADGRRASRRIPQCGWRHRMRHRRREASYRSMLARAVAQPIQAAFGLEAFQNRQFLWFPGQRFPRKKHRPLRRHRLELKVTVPLLDKMWDTLVTNGVLAPWLIKRAGRATSEVRRDEILMIAQAQKDADEIRSGRMVL